MSHLIRPVAAALALGAAAVGLTLAGAGPASAAIIGHHGETTVQVSEVGVASSSGRLVVHAGEVLTATDGPDGRVRLTVAQDSNLPQGDLRVVDDTAHALNVVESKHLTGVPVRTTHHFGVVADGVLTFSL